MTMTIALLSIDLAKSVFVLLGLDEAVRVALKLRQ